MKVNSRSVDNLKIGDLVPSAGIYTNPGVIIEKKENGIVRIDTSQEAIEQYHKFGDTTGLTEEEKNTFNTIMQEVMDVADRKERLEILQQKIDDLNRDKNNKEILKKLSIRQRILIRQAGDLPRFYEFDGNVISKR